VTCRVEQDSDVVLGLELGERRTQRQGLANGRLELADFDVEVELHLLVAGLRRPGRAFVDLLELDGQIGDAIGWARVTQVGSSLAIRQCISAA